jgi:hypothetical protein
VKLNVGTETARAQKAVLEGVLKKKMAEHLKASYRELTPS